MAKVNKVKLTLGEGASQEFDIDHAERILNLQKTSFGLNKAKGKLWELPSNSNYKLQDGKLIKNTSSGDSKEPEK